MSVSRYMSTSVYVSMSVSGTWVCSGESVGVYAVGAFPRVSPELLKRGRHAADRFGTEE